MHATLQRCRCYICTAVFKASTCCFRKYDLLIHVFGAAARQKMTSIVLFCLQYKPSEVLQLKGKPEWYPCSTLYFKTFVHREQDKSTLQDCIADVDNDDHFQCKLAYSHANKVKVFAHGLGLCTGIC